MAEHAPAPSGPPVVEATVGPESASTAEDEEEIEAALRSLRQEFDGDLHCEPAAANNSSTAVGDEYDWPDSGSESLACEMERLTIDPSALSRPFATFKFLLQYEVTRVSLALGLTPEDCESRVPMVAEQFSLAFLKARSKQELWDTMKLFSQQLAGNDAVKKSFPEPPSDRCWLLLNNAKHHCWENGLELGGSLSPLTKAGRFNPRILLNPPSLGGTGHKFAHRFGSDRFMTLRIPIRKRGRSESDVQEPIVRWLVNEKLRLINREWACFSIKTDSKRRKKDVREAVGIDAMNPDKRRLSDKEDFLLAFFFAERGVGLGEPSYLVQERLGFLRDVGAELIRAEMSRDDLIRWHMPIEKHMGSPFAKIWSRIALGKPPPTPSSHSI